MDRITRSCSMTWVLLGTALVVTLTRCPGSSADTHGLTTDFHCAGGQRGLYVGPADTSLRALRTLSYPSTAYGNNQDCTVSLQPASGFVAVLVAWDIHLERQYSDGTCVDYLEVNGNKKLCRNTAGGVFQEVSLRFYSNGGLHRVRPLFLTVKGFIINYIAYGCNTNELRSVPGLSGYYYEYNNNRDKFGLGSATMLCKPDHYFNGDKESKSITCNTGNNTWDPQLKSAQCELLRCGTPDLENGGYTFQNESVSLELGSVVLYWCQEGFSLFGTSEQECTRNRLWIPEPTPKCQLVDCGPPLFQNSSTMFAELLNGTSTEYLSQAEYRCVEGYHLVPGPSPVVTCLSNGNWSHTLECVMNSTDASAQVESGSLLEVILPVVLLSVLTGCFIVTGVFFFKRRKNQSESKLTSVQDHVSTRRFNDNNDNQNNYDCIEEGDANSAFFTAAPPSPDEAVYTNINRGTRSANESLRTKTHNMLYDSVTETTSLVDGVTDAKISSLVEEPEGAKGSNVENDRSRFAVSKPNWDRGGSSQEYSLVGEYDTADLYQPSNSATLEGEQEDGNVYSLVGEYGKTETIDELNRGEAGNGGEPLGADGGLYEEPVKLIHNEIYHTARK